jgi:hypothetical protein
VESRATAAENCIAHQLYTLAPPAQSQAGAVCPRTEGLPVPLQVERRVAGSFNPRDLACITAAFAAASQGASVAALPAATNATPAATNATGALTGEAGDDATRRVLGRIATEALECGAGIERFDPQVTTLPHVLTCWLGGVSGAYRA